MKKRLDIYRELVHIAVKEFTWIGTKISKDKHAIDINIAFGDQLVIIPIKCKDIDKASHSAKDFVKLIKPLLENVLKGKIQ